MDTQKNILDVPEKSCSDGRLMFFHPVAAILLAKFYGTNKQIHMYPTNPTKKNTTMAMPKKNTTMAMQNAGSSCMGLWY